MTELENITEVLQQHAPMMARIAATYEADQGIRQDLIQDMSLAVWRALTRFRGEASLKTYIARIAHNRAVDHVLKESRRQEQYHEDGQLGELASHDGPHHQDGAMDLMAGLHQLAIGYRQVVALQLEGFSQAEISQTLGLTEAAVAQRARRARLQLEQILRGKT